MIGALFAKGRGKKELPGVLREDWYDEATWAEWIRYAAQR
jgi:hypothetical protein